MPKEQLTESQSPLLHDEQGPIPVFPPLKIDPATGRAILPSAEELTARYAALRRARKVLDRLPDNDPPDVFTEGMRDIDSERPEGGKLFEGMY
jgi:hypothetical protein